MGTRTTQIGRIDADRTTENSDPRSSALSALSVFYSWMMYGNADDADDARRLDGLTRIAQLAQNSDPRSSALSALSVFYSWMMYGNAIDDADWTD
jgi:hypothetical protein